jgi:hypothetical protein
MGVALLALGSLGALILPPAGADITFTGQGVSVPSGCTGTGNTEEIHFILTSPAGSSSTLTITTDPGGTQQVDGTQSGGGSIQFFVDAPFGATITSASATGETGNSQLTVSGCTNITTTTTTTTTTATTMPSTPTTAGAQVSPATASAASPATAVAGAARFTG